MIELRLILPDQQFAKIYIYKTHKYPNTILSTLKQYKLENKVDQLCYNRITF